MVPTPEGIPIVTESIANVLGRDIQTRGPDYSLELYRILKQEQPIIAGYLESQDSSLRSGKLPNPASQDVIILYHMIRKQGEADNLSNLL